MARPDISVVMSVYNGEDYLAETLDSICRQSFQNWELIAIDDCSTDGSGRILAEYAEADSRIRIYRNETNLRLPASLNKAVALAAGRYIARMDADDICLENRLAAQFAFMESHPELSLSFCRFMTLENETVAPGSCGVRCDAESVKALLLVTNPILHPGVIVKAALMKQMPYDTALTCSEDLMLWTQMAARGVKMAAQDEYLMLYRLHGKQITSTTLARQHDEVLRIEKAFYADVLEPLDDAQAAFYIKGIYFREAPDIEKFCAFYRAVKRANREKGCFDSRALDYAAVEILAEYKRHGVSAKKLLKGACCIGLPYFVAELAARKKRARADAAKCEETALEIGMTRVGGTDTFPIFRR